MKRLIFGSVFAASMFSMTAAAAELKGTISDASCAAKHADASEASKKCVQGCVKRGTAPVFVSEDGKVYKIEEASRAKVMDHLGDRVTLQGTMAGDTVTIESVS